MKIRQISVLFFLSLCCAFVKAQYTETDIYDYIEKYGNLAIEKMETYKIPASITLSQGILESAAGTSDLAVNANNHFGIKCHSNWNGETFYKDDDEDSECFRKYDKVEDSYNDHSKFLKAKRYENLFKLEPDDYKAWAKGLKTYGYATNPQYAERLINLIEKYNLYKFDSIVLYGNGAKFENAAMIDITDSTMHSIGSKKSETLRMGLKSVKYPYTDRRVYTVNDTYFIIAKRGDTYTEIAKNVQQPLFYIKKFNDLPNSTYEPQNNEWVFIEKKAKYSKEYKSHIVRCDGESLRDICQKYGCKISSIMALNDLERDAQLKRGQVILLQKRQEK